MRLQSTEGIGRLCETCPAQDFVNRMEAKIEDLILTAYDYLEGNEVEGPHDRVEISRRKLHDLIGTAEDIGKEFRTLADDPCMWEQPHYT